MEMRTPEPVPDDEDGDTEKHHARKQIDRGQSGRGL